MWIVGASSGIGEALALALARRGARLALSARGRERLEAVCAACDAAAGGGPAGGDAAAFALLRPPRMRRPPGARARLRTRLASLRAAPIGPLARALALDLTRTDELERARDQLLADWGGIDLVVFNAGTYRPLRAWELSAQAVRETLETNLLGTMSATAAVLPTLLAQGAGAIALVGSVAGYGGLPKATVYGPSKAALINFAEVLHLDLSPRGVGVFLIDPGFVATPLTAQNDFAMPALQTPAQAAAAIVRRLRARRLRDPLPEALHARAEAPAAAAASPLLRADPPRHRPVELAAMTDPKLPEPLPAAGSTPEPGTGNRPPCAWRASTRR